MKLQNLATNPHQSSVPEERDKNAPTLDEIRRRAFEIHIERGGHGGDIDGYLDAWLQADRELREEYNKVDDEDAKRK
jgi:hypothetical protein